MENKKKFIEEICSAFDESQEPKIVVDETLDVIYANKSARSCYGLLGTKSGIRSIIGNAGVEKVLDGLSRSYVYRLETENTPVYRIFCFVKNLCGGDECCILVTIEDDYGINQRIGQLISSKDLLDLIRCELTLPTADMNTNILFMKKRIPDGDILCGYVAALEKSVYRLRRGLTNLNMLINAVQGVCIENKEIVHINDFIKKISSKLMLRFEKNDYEQPLILFSNSVLVKTVLDCVNFLYEQQSYSKDKISIGIDDKGSLWSVCLTRFNTSLSIPNGDVFKPFITEKNTVHSNLGAIKYIINQNGGNIIVLQKGKDLCVMLSFPKFFFDDTGASLMDDIFNDIEYYIENVYSADYDYFHKLLGDNKK